jgi:aspartate carbamoyltransferase catalytic subunit
MAGNSEKANPLLGKSLTSIKELDKGAVERILEESAVMLKAYESGARLNALHGKILANLFYEPSTRTRMSFESAMLRLGGGTIGFADPSTSSSTKGETLADTVKVVSGFADIIVLRYPEKGAAKEAAAHADVPVVNAGDGAGEHPTQTLYDLFTIKMEKKRLHGLNVALVGDLKYGRAIHSIAYALALFGNDMTFIAPKQLQMPEGITKELKDEYGIGITESDSLESALDADVVYIPRVQRERFPDPEEYRRFANYYVIDKKFLSRANKEIRIMSPLPRVTEISTEIDNTKNAVYFKQSAYGVPVRMAILNLILGGSLAKEI